MQITRTGILSGVFKFILITVSGLELPTYEDHKVCCLHSLCWLPGEQSLPHWATCYFTIPGSLPAIFIMESLMEQVAKSINKDATDIRLMNMYTQGQVISSWNTSCLPNTA